MALNLAALRRVEGRLMTWWRDDSAHGPSVRRSAAKFAVGTGRAGSEVCGILLLADILKFV
jgi:hypothetical protein